MKRYLDYVVHYSTTTGGYYFGEIFDTISGQTIVVTKGHYAHADAVKDCLDRITEMEKVTQ